MQYEDCVRQILDELRRVQGLPDCMPGVDDFQGFIDTGELGGLIVTIEIDRLIVKFAEAVIERDASILRRFTLKEWIALVRQAFGPALGRVDLDSDATANTVVSSVLAAVDNISESYERRCYVVGCEFLQNVDIDPVEMGPVLIESRDKWLSRVVYNGIIGADVAASVAEIWSGRPVGSSEYPDILARKVTQSVGECSYICSVRTEKFPPKTGEEKALLAARLVLSGVALIWSSPSKVLDGFRLQVDKNDSPKHVVAFEPGGKFFASAGRRHAPSGPNVRSTEWHDQIGRFAPLLRSVAEVAEYAVHVTGEVDRPNICHVLMQALLWFHEACREPIDAMAIVKFTITLDALAGGKGEANIRRLLSNRVGWRDDSPIYRDSELTMKHAVAQVYKEGRSRTVHGTSARILMDHSKMRKLAEVLAANALLGCLLWVARNAGEDSPALLVSGENDRTAPH